MIDLTTNGLINRCHVMTELPLTSYDQLFGSSNRFFSSLLFQSIIHNLDDFRNCIGLIGCPMVILRERCYLFLRNRSITDLGSLNEITFRSRTQTKFLVNLTDNTRPLCLKISEINVILRYFLLLCYSWLFQLCR